MGHESLTTTMKYLHPETANIKAVIDQRNQKKMAAATDTNKYDAAASTATKTATGGLAAAL
jgi:hypothetical protein